MVKTIEFGDKLMKITICHLSDIHFNLSRNYILNKKYRLYNAIAQALSICDTVIILVIGDIYQSEKITRI